MSFQERKRERKYSFVVRSFSDIKEKKSSKCAHVSSVIPIGISEFAIGFTHNHKKNQMKNADIKKLLNRSLIKDFIFKVGFTKNVDVVLIILFLHKRKEQSLS